MPKPCKRGAIADRDKWGNCLCGACFKSRQDRRNSCNRKRYWENPEARKKSIEYNVQRSRKLHALNPKKNMLYSAKKRAEKLGLLFSLTEEDINIPEVCPVLGIKLEVNEGRVRDNSPSLDRIIPELGYVAENVAVISNKANSIKQNASAEEIQAVATWVLAQTKRIVSV